VDTAIDETRGDWTPAAAAHTDDYLRALGVDDPTERTLLSERVRQRTLARAAVVPFDEPLEAAIEDTLFLLDEWLAAELDAAGVGEAARDLVPAARAAVLAGAVPGWSARWAGVTHLPLGAALHVACLAAVPPPAPLVMEPNPIRLCCHQLRARIGAALPTGAPRVQRPERRP